MNSFPPCHYRSDTPDAIRLEFVCKHFLGTLHHLVGCGWLLWNHTQANENLRENARKCETFRWFKWCVSVESFVRKGYHIEAGKLGIIFKHKGFMCKQVIAHLGGWNEFHVHHTRCCTQNAGWRREIVTMRLGSRYLSFWSGKNGECWKCEVWHLAAMFRSLSLFSSLVENLSKVNDYINVMCLVIDTLGTKRD